MGTECSNVHHHVRFIVNVVIFSIAGIVRHVVVDHRIFALDDVLMLTLDIDKVTGNHRFSINQNQSPNFLTDIFFNLYTTFCFLNIYMNKFETNQDVLSGKSSYSGINVSHIYLVDLFTNKIEEYIKQMSLFLSG